jgi:hypothetical protein
MELTRQLAVAWKETKQLKLVYILFVLLTILNVYVIFDSSKKSDVDMIQRSFYQMLFFYAPIIAFLLGAGNRINEASGNLESFLTYRPIRRFSMVTVYYLQGVFGWFAWLTLYLLMQVVIYGIDIIRPATYITQGHAVTLIPFISFINLTLLYLSVYTATFSMGLLAPHYVYCGFVCAGYYIAALFLITSDKYLDQYMGAQLYWAVYVVLVAILPIILVPTYSIYKRIQIGCRS